MIGLVVAWDCDWLGGGLGLCLENQARAIQISQCQVIWHFYHTFDQLHKEIWIHDKHMLYLTYYLFAYMYVGITLSAYVIITVIFTF